MRKRQAGLPVTYSLMPTRPSVTRPSSRATALASVRALVDTLYRSARGVEQRTGRTNAQISILRHVARHGPLTVNEVAAAVRTGQSTASLVLTRLQRAGLVRRVASREDRRRVLVEATVRGKALARRAPRPATDQLIAAVEKLPERDAAGIARCLAPLLKALHKSTRRPPMLFE